MNLPLRLLAAGCVVSWLAACGSGGGSGTGSAFPTEGVGTAEVLASVPGDGGGWIAVRLRFPATGRYDTGPGTSEAPVVLEVPVFLTGTPGFQQSLRPEPDGFVHVSFAWPGVTDGPTSKASDGTYDYAGPAGLSALRHVLRFLLGHTLTHDGLPITALGGSSGVTPLPANVGTYAFSHPGIPATCVMAAHGTELTDLAYFVGRENPTQDVLTCVELGHWDPQPPAHVPNPFYDFTTHYDPLDIDLGGANYGFVKWAADKPYFEMAPQTYVLGDRVPRMFGKRHYSRRLTRALADNGAIPGAWPSDLATPAEAAANWAGRETPSAYADVVSRMPDLAVLLLFADDDHVQPQLDKPHIHQAWDGFRGGSGVRWIRLNGDLAYAEAIYGTAPPGTPDHDANLGPAAWNDIRWMGYPRNAPGAAERFARAAVAEMADRMRYGNWSNNLTAVLP